MLVLPRDVRDAICAHARKGYPHEVCGVLLGRSHGVEPAAKREAIVAFAGTNLEAARPNDRYTLDPKDMVAADRLARERGLEIMGFYHSHPDHPAKASQTDLENSSPWGGYSYPIVSVVKGDVADLRSWAREGDAWTEEAIDGGDVMATVRIPTPLRPITKGQEEVSGKGADVRAVLDDVARQFTGLRERILDDKGEVRRFVNVFVNQDDIRGSAGLATAVKDGDVISILPAIAGGVTFPEWKAQLAREIPEVLARDVQGARDKGEDVVLIDVRTKDEWQQGHVPGAIHLDRGYLELKVESLVADKSRRVVCYCAGGTRSLFAANALKQLGYGRVESLVKGFAGWKEAGLSFATPVALSDAQRRRYQRHLSIPEVGEDGQAKLLASKVLCIGAGGLGSPAAIYLAAAGVGTLGLVDDDVVDESNLQRQILHTTDRLGKPKTESAKVAITALNPDVKVEEHRVRLTSENVLDLFARYDVIVDGSDNFPTRYLVNDACVKLQKPCVHGSIYRFEGQLTVFWPGKGPCYRCLYPAPPPPDMAPSCAEAGVLGVLPGVIGVLEAVEAIKIIIGKGEPLVGRLVHYDALGTKFRELKLRQDPKCAYCAPGTPFPGLVDYEHFCSTGGAAKPEAAKPVEATKPAMEPGGTAAHRGAGASPKPLEIRIAARPVATKSDNTSGGGTCT